MNFDDGTKARSLLDEVYRKLDASSRAEAVDQAREAGLLRDEPNTPVGQ